MEGVEKVHIDELQISIDFIPKSSTLIRFVFIIPRPIIGREERVTESGLHVKLYIQ
jgi:hypothetical protein